MCKSSVSLLVFCGFDTKAVVSEWGGGGFMLGQGCVGVTFKSDGGAELSGSWVYGT